PTRARRGAPHAAAAIRAGHRAGLHRRAAPRRSDGDGARAARLQLRSAAHALSTARAGGGRPRRTGAGGGHGDPLSCALAHRSGAARDVFLTPPGCAPSMTHLHATNGRRRVVVTGVGLVTPLGTGTERNWEGLAAGRSGVRAISRFDASILPARVAGEVPDFERSEEHTSELQS